MQLRWTLLALAASLLCVRSASGLAEFGSEGMVVFSTPANEARATLRPELLMRKPSVGRTDKT